MRDYPHKYWLSFGNFYFAVCFEHAEGSVSDARTKVIGAGVPVHFAAGDEPSAGPGKVAQKLMRKACLKVLAGIA